MATLFIAAIGVPLSKVAQLFGPAEYFSLMILGLVLTVVLARGSIFKAIAMILLGVLLSTVGTDLETGEERLTFGWNEISDGLDFAVIAMGVFGFAEVLKNLENPELGFCFVGTISFPKGSLRVTTGTPFDPIGKALEDL